MTRLLQRRSLQTGIRYTLISVLTIILTLGWTLLDGMPQAYSQISVSSPETSSSSTEPPDEVSRYGEYEVTSIRSLLDNQTLFEIASPIILDRDNIPAGKLPVEVRAQEITDRLWRVFIRTGEAKQTPTVAIATLNNRPVLLLKDDRTSRPMRLVTITEPDADYHGKTLDELANEWKDSLQVEVTRFKQLTAPEALGQRLAQALQIIMGLLIASVVIWFLRRLLSRRQQTLEARYQAQLAAIADAEKAQQVDSNSSSEIMEGEETEAREIADLRSQFLAALQHQFSVKRRLDIDKFFKWALFWIFIVMWFVGIYRIMSTIPYLMRWSLYVWATPLTLLVIWFGVSFAIRISKSLIDRFMHSWQVNPLLSFGEAQRVALRTVTISSALKGFATFVLIIAGIIWTLSVFNIPTSSVLAGSAVIGLAVSFGTQNLVKDLVNGCLILLEDQFAVGDVIEIDGKSGLVENLNLRVTQLRSSEGELITIPNSNITNVSNLTRLWSRIDFTIIVAYENDPKLVLEVLRQISKQLYSEPQWRDRLPEPPDVLGIDDLSHTGMLIRVWIKTAPMEQWSVGREFRLRVRQAFEANQIQIGRPEWINYTTDLGQLRSSAK